MNIDDWASLALTVDFGLVILTLIVVLSTLKNKASAKIKDGMFSVFFGFSVITILLCLLSMALR